MTLRTVASAVLAVMLVGTVFVGTAAMGVAAQDPADEDRDEVRIVDEEVTIADGLLTISDTQVDGPGLGDHHFEDETYTVDSTLQFDGFHVTWDGTDYTFCKITVHIEDVGVHLQNVTVNDGE